MSIADLLKYGHVIGRFVATIGDADDADDYPDELPLTGTVTFTPSVGSMLVTDTDEPTTVFPRPIVATLDAEGRLGIDGAYGVWLQATDDPMVNPTNFTYVVSFDLTLNGQAKVDYKPFAITLPADSVVDLTVVTPVEVSEGVTIIKGDKGDPGASLLVKGQVATTNDLPVDAGDGDVYVVQSDGHYYVSLSGQWTDIGAVTGPKGDPGAPGRSAYEVALDEGYSGTEEEWLASLVGPAGAGASAYEEAVANGFTGTETEWLASLKGEPGDSAYEIAVQNGYTGTEEEWVDAVGGGGAVSSVAGRTGDVTLTSADLTDATSVGQQLVGATDAANARFVIGASDLALGETADTAKAGDWQPASTDITDASDVGKAVLVAPDAGQARSAIGAGTSDLVVGTTADTAKAGDWKPTALDVSDSTQIGRDVLTAGSAGSARNTLGAQASLGTGSTSQFLRGDLTWAAPPSGGGGGSVSRIASAAVFSSLITGVVADEANGIYVCDGVGDEVEINAAIAAVTANGRGKVQLIGGEFNIAGAISVRTGLWLCGEGPGTIVEATADFNAGMIQSYDNTLHASKVSDLTLHGASKAVHGLYYNLHDGDAGWGTDPSTAPDTANVVRDLFIYSVGSSAFAGHGLWFGGGRGNKYDNIRVLNAAGCGVFVDGADSHYSNIEVGSCGDDALTYSEDQSTPQGHGFFCNGSNSMFVNCKAWYSRGDGFYMREQRSQFVNCQAQDNYGHGFNVHLGLITLTGCVADSNGQGLGAAQNGGGRAGFYFKYASHMAMSGCLALDRGQSWQQQYGYQFTSGFYNSMLVGCVSDGNAVASQTGTPGASVTIQIQADADGK